MDNYYTNEIKMYNGNYSDAINKINNIIKLLNDLLNAFIGASGDDVETIKVDINLLIDKLKTIKTTISDKKTSTNTNATNSDKVYKEVKALPTTPTSENKYDVLESTGEKKVYIENGKIYREENFRKIPVQEYHKYFGAIAAIRKYNNSYPIITATLYADVESMLEGEVKMLPLTK